MTTLQNCNKFLTLNFYMSEDDIDNMDFELPSDENISHQFGQMQVLETESGVSAETLARFKG